MYKIALNIFKLFLLLVLFYSVGFPMHGFGQEELSSASSTPSTPDTLSASSTLQLIRDEIGDGPAGEGVDEGVTGGTVDEGATGDVPEEPEEVEEAPEETPEAVEAVEEVPEEIEDVELEDFIGPPKLVIPDIVLINRNLKKVPPEPPLTVRKFTKKVIIDTNAAHSCEVENFRIDISNKKIVDVSVELFKSNQENFYTLDVGGLPEGIDVIFSKNKDHTYSVEEGESIVGLRILNQKGSQTGDFNIPLIFSEEIIDSLVDKKIKSLAICQINIVNNI